LSYGRIGEKYKFRVLEREAETKVYHKAHEDKMNIYFTAEDAEGAVNKLKLETRRLPRKIAMDHQVHEVHKEHIKG